MNKLREFDYIHTPKEWIDDLYNQPCAKLPHIPYRMIIIGLLIFCISSLSLVYAYHDEFRMWLKGEVPEINNTNIMKIENYFEINNEFMCISKNNEEFEDTYENVEKVKVLKDGLFQDVDQQHFETIYKNHRLSFDYVINDCHILTFNHEGMIYSSFQVMNNQTMYFLSCSGDICSLDFISKKIERLTYDNRSLNRYISPAASYIVTRDIEKEKCFLYDIQTGQTRELKSLSPYAHYNNEFAFLDDSHIITYSGEIRDDIDTTMYTCIIDLKTLETTALNGKGYYPSISYLEISYEDEKMVIKDLITHQERMIDNDMRYIDYMYVVDNRYIFYEVNNDVEKVQYIYDFKSNQMKELHIQHEEAIECRSINGEYLLLSMGDDYQIVSFEELFGKK